MKHSRTQSSIVAAVAAVSLAGYASAASYQVNSVITLPYVSNDTPTTTNPTKYTTINQTFLPRATLPNGSYQSTIVGSLGGALVSSPSVSIFTAFAYDPTNGFRLIGLYTPTSTGAHTTANIAYVNGVGQVIGTSAINSTSSATSGIFGSQAWLYSPTNNSNVAIGLTGPNFSYTATVTAAQSTTGSSFTGSYSSSTPRFINDPGQIVGTTSRYAGDAAGTPSTSLGTSAFLYTSSSATPMEIGLYGAGYSYQATTGTGTTDRYSSNGITGLTNTGIIIGSATPYYDVGNGTGTGLGTDGWVSVNGATPTAIGLYQRGTDPNVSAATGVDTSGYHYYSTPSGTVGSTPALSQNRATALAAVNGSGQVIGSSTYYSGTAFKGTDAFVYSNATGQYRQLGFTSNGFTSTTPAAGSTSFVSTAGARSTTPLYINTAGTTVGTSTQYLYYNNTSGVSTAASGTVAWVDTGAGPNRIGLYGQASDPNASRHVNPQTGAASSAVTNLTDSGFVGGNSTRYYLNGTTGSSLGQDAWVYNSGTGLTYTVDPTDAATGNYEFSSILYLSESGVAVGQYEAGTSTSSSGLYLKAFLWSLASGFVDLNTNVSGLSTTAYQNLIASFYSTADGGTLYATASTGLNGTVGGLVTLNGAVPEPTSLGALVVGSVGLLARRRRRAV